jgi:hypothetical protein
MMLLKPFGSGSLCFLRLTRPLIRREWAGFIGFGVNRGHSNQAFCLSGHDINEHASNFFVKQNLGKRQTLG